MDNIYPFRINIVVKIIAIFVLCLFFLALFLNSIKEDATHAITPPGDYSEKFISFNVENIAEISEVLKLTDPSLYEPISVAVYFPLKDVLLSISASDGILKAWSLEDEKILYKHNLEITSNVGLGFDTLGDLVMGSIWHQVRENDYGELTDDIGGVAIWDTKTGSLIICIVYPCDTTAPSSEWKKYLISGTVIDPKGRWVLSLNDTMFSVYDINRIQGPYSIGESRIDGSNRRMAMGAFNPSGNNYAIAHRDGGVTIRRLGGSSLNWFSPKINLGSDEINTIHQVVSLNYSPDGRWLARIQDEILTVWKANKRSEALHFEGKIAESKLLAFDQLSNFLFIGTTEEVFVWDIKAMSIRFKIATPGITTLTVSSDNRLLIWGDKNGSIHIWGILDPNKE